LVKTCYTNVEASDPACTNPVSPHIGLHILELVPWQGHTKTVGASPLPHSIIWRPRIWERPVLNPGTQKSWGVLVQHLQSYSDLPRWSVLNRGLQAVVGRPTRGGQKLQTYITWKHKLKLLQIGLQRCWMWPKR
jgi:hypothetical protein